MYIAKFLTSFRAVVTGFLLFSFYRMAEAGYLFYSILVFPFWLKLVATILLTPVIVGSLALFAVNAEFFAKGRDIRRPVLFVMFCFTLLINVMFWKTWDPTLDSSLSEIPRPLAFTFKWVVAFFFAAFDYAYAHLFLARWEARNQDVIDQRQVLQNDVSQLEARHQELELKINQSTEELSQLIARQDPKVCPRCAQEFDNSMQRNGHLRTCRL